MSQANGSGNNPGRQLRGGEFYSPVQARVHSNDVVLSELRPFTAVFNPAGVAHNTVIGAAGAAFFTIEFREETLRQLGIRLPGRTTFDRGAGTMLWPGLRLYSE